MKKLLIGFSNNVSQNKDKIKLWINSFRKNSDARAVLIIGNATEEDRQVCLNLNLDFEEVVLKKEDFHLVNHKRLEHILNYLKKIDEDLILSTDVFDVVFQRDPFKKLDSKFDFYAGGEGVNVNQEPWNRKNIENLFSNEVLKCDNQEVVCSGVLAGKREILIKIYERMFELCETALNRDDIRDQAALILMIARNEIENKKIFNLDEAWAVHCAVAGPTPFFEKWGFKNNIKYGIPKLIGGEICTSEGIPFDIVHQFNRIENWNKIIKEKWGSI